MVIDLILDRKDGVAYSPHKFYSECMEYASIFKMKTIDNITLAMDYGTNEDVKNAINDYIIKNEYNPEICDWVNTQEWI